MGPAHALAVAALLAGCGKKGPSDPAAEERARDRQIIRDLLEAGRYLEDGRTAAVQPLLPKPEQPGPAYLWIDHVGLVTIDAGKAELVRYPDPASSRFQVFVKAMVIDGVDPLILGDAGVVRIRAGVRQELGKPEDLLGLSLLALAPDGAIWVGNDQHVARWKDGAWKTEPVEVPDLAAIDFDGAGHVFATGRDEVWVRDGSAWKPIVRTGKLTEANGRKPSWQQTLVSPTGELWVLSCDQLMRIAAGKVTVQDLPDPGFSQGRFVGDSLVGISCFTSSVVSIAPSGVLTELPPSAARVEGYTRAVDGSGRAWIALRSERVAVRDATGTIEWPAGSIPAISGDVAAIAVVGKGPRDLPTVVKDVRATITGRVLRDGQPVPGASIELCRRPVLPEPTPCAKAPERLVGDTDATGAFHIRAPLRSLRVAAKVAGNWYTLLNHECTGLAPDATCEIGTLELSKAMNPTEGASGLRFISDHAGE